MKIVGSSGRGNASVNTTARRIPIAMATLMTVSVCHSGLWALSVARVFCHCIVEWPCSIMTSLFGRRFGFSMRGKSTETAINALFVLTDSLAVGLECPGGDSGKILAAEVVSFVCNII